MEDYYLDELLAIFEEYSILHEIGEESEEERMGVMEFFGGGE